MKFLRRLVVNIPDQIISTGVIVVMGYIFIRGVMVTWMEPPNILLYLIILGVGTLFGIEASRRDVTANKNKRND